MVFSNLFDENASIDIIGQSYYPWWHGSLDDLSNNLALFDFSEKILQGITVFESENAEIDENIIPESTSLQLFPNPFNPTTNIRYENPIFGFVEIMIYNINGELVETLVNRDQRQGEQSILWNADKFSSCVYFYQLKLDGEIFRTKRAVLLK